MSLPSLLAEGADVVQLLDDVVMAAQRVTDVPVEVLVVLQSPRRGGVHLEVVLGDGRGGGQEEHPRGGGGTRRSRPWRGEQL